MEGATALASGKSIGSLTRLNMDLGKTLGGLSFSELGSGFGGFFSSSPALPPPVIYNLSLCLHTA